jgi:hypothetical protein
MPTLTSLIQPFNVALNVVSRELTGAIPGVTRDARADRAALNEPVYVPIAPPSAAFNITPAMTPSAGATQAIGNESIIITKSRGVKFEWNGEDTLGVNNSGSGASSIQGDQIQEAIRTLVNEMEADVITAARMGSRAFGTATTTPFATDLSEIANMKKILDDNGAPGMRSLVFDTSAGVKMRGQTQLTKANESGTVMTLRDGELLDIFGFSARESAGIASVTKGTGANYTSDTAGYAIGATDIALITGTGTVLEGDIVTFAGDTNKYIVKTGVAAPGTISLASPGLKVALAASAVAMTIVATSVRNVAFSRSAVVLATRAPALPAQGDIAMDRTQIVDPRTGIVFELSMYGGVRMIQYEVSAAWGAKCIKRSHAAVLLG